MGKMEVRLIVLGGIRDMAVGVLSSKMRALVRIMSESIFDD